MHIVRFVGGLGNQLFQLQLYERLIEQHGRENVYADVSYYRTNVCHSGFELSNGVTLNTIDRIPRKRVKVDEESFKGLKCDDRTTYYYDGYWQSRSYFPRSMTLVNGFFESIKLDGRNAKCCDEIRQCGNSVSIHIRRGDYTDNYLHGNIANRSYYQNAIDHVNSHNENVTYYVFSDDMDWCRANLNFGLAEKIYVDWNKDDVCADILLMSECRINIISNSSFSWWAQYINKCEDKVLITPEYWFNNETDKHHPELVGTVMIPNYSSRSVCDSPLFSVIIPAYNSEYVIRRCLSSVLNQTLSDIEVIVVNDGSTDDTKQVVEKYAGKDHRIRLIEHSANQSLLAARITGMREATGKHIIFVDSDDYIDGKACEILHSHLTQNPADIVEFSYVSEPDGVIAAWDLKDVGPIDILIGRHPETVWNKCYSRKLVTDALKYIESFYCNMGEDGYFTTIFFAIRDSFYRISDVLYHYVALGGMSNYNNMVDVDKHISSLRSRDEHLRIFADSYGNIKSEEIEEFFMRDVRSVGKLCIYSRNTSQIKKSYLQRIDKLCNTRLYRMYQASKQGLVDAVKERKPLVIMNVLGFFLARKVKEQITGHGNEDRI